MAMLTPSIATIGEIARRLAVPVHRIEYVIRARGIPPCGRAGNTRVFAEETVKTIAAALQQIEGAKSHRERL